MTRKGCVLLACPDTVTTTDPDVAPVGTFATIFVADHDVIDVAGVPLKVIVLVPWVDPKLKPFTVTEAPTLPEVGLMLVIPGPDPTTKITPLLDKPPTVTMTGPVVAPLGTGTAMLVALQAVGTAGVPLKVTTLEPCVDPKFVPVIVTAVPTFPEPGLNEVMLGIAPTTKLTPLLA